MNGRIGSDAGLGAMTCQTGMGQSSIDYLLMSAGLIPHINSFEILTHDKCTSDTHSGLLVSLQCNAKKGNESNENEGSCNLLSFELKWDPSKTEEFLLNFDQSQIEEFNTSLESVNCNHASQEEIDSLYSHFKNIFYDTAKVTGIYKKIKISRGRYLEVVFS